MTLAAPSTTRSRPADRVTLPLARTSLSESVPTVPNRMSRPAATVMLPADAVIASLLTVAVTSAPAPVADSNTLPEALPPATISTPPVSWSVMVPPAEKLRSPDVTTRRPLKLPVTPPTKTGPVLEMLMPPVLVCASITETVVPRAEDAVPMPVPAVIARLTTVTSGPKWLS